MTDFSRKLNRKGIDSVINSPTDTMTHSPLVNRINELIEEKSLLKHPFYRMWSDGALTLDMIAGYSKEYFQMVKAVPEYVASIIETAPEELHDGLKANQDEEAGHIELWEKFAMALGIGEEEIKAYSGTEKTQAAVENLSELMTSLEKGAVAMYAFEKDIPRISHTKLEGLKEFYSISSAEATEYFREHKEADILHAAAWQGVLEAIPEDRYEELVKVAEKSLAAQNLLLDSCYESYCEA